MLQVERLTKRYGAVTAVDDLSFEIESEGVYGFLGPNGAGKTTTMNIMTGCLSATQGTVRISGCDIYEEPRAAKRRVGYLPEQPPLYLGETPAEYLRFVGQAKGVRGERLRRQMEDVIEETGIGDMRNRRISALSKGYRQRVGIAQALLGEPDTVILDEPTVGLDPIQILEIRALIASLGKSRTVLISSHILSEVQNMCSKILIIAHGRLVAFDTPDALEARLAAPGEISLLSQPQTFMSSVSLLTMRSPAEKRQRASANSRAERRSRRVLHTSSAVARSSAASPQRSSSTCAPCRRRMALTQASSSRPSNGLPR